MISVCFIFFHAEHIQTEKAHDGRILMMIMKGGLVLYETYPLKFPADNHLEIMSILGVLSLSVSWSIQCYLGIVSIMQLLQFYGWVSGFGTCSLLNVFIWFCFPANKYRVLITIGKLCQD